MTNSVQFGKRKKLSPSIQAMRMRWLYLPASGWRAVILKARYEILGTDVIDEARPILGFNC